jgi:hypothetical protein
VGRDETAGDTESEGAMNTAVKELLDVFRRYRTGSANETAVAEAIIGLAAEIRRLDTELEKLKRQSRQTASIANCLANGIQPD